MSLTLHSGHITPLLAQLIGELKQSIYYLLLLEPLRMLSLELELLPRMEIIFISIILDLMQQLLVKLMLHLVL